MKIGLVGYQGSGKSSLFTWLSGVGADPSMAHTAQTAMATVQDPRVDQLCEIYHPKKITLASLEIVDTPGLSRTHEGNAPRLGHIREAGCLVHVVSAFAKSDPLADVRGFEEDMILTDLEIALGRVERLRESLKKPRPNRDEQAAELAAIEPLCEKLEDGETLGDLEFTDDQIKATNSFGLLTRKRRLVLMNVADDESAPERFQDAGLGVEIVAVPVGLELELSRMSPEEAQEFRTEMGVESYDRDGLIRQLMAHADRMLFFTAGEKEVRTWMIPRGATAVEAAGSIHSDMARGFIRAEIMTCDDLIRLGSEREVKANHLVRQEPKDYVIQDGDILNIRFSV
jgi:ribosome-binding ATPase YchF (GTP1/OBG family)